jgi:hypothetical protein
MVETEKLLRRLDEIGQSLSKRKSALALIALGSVGENLERLDQYSDLDFFVIVEEGSKPEYLKNLVWLTDIYPVAYYFQNTADGFKLLYEDGVFCEFAIFDETELQDAIFSPGRIVWKAEGVDDAIRIPKRKKAVQQPQSEEWLVGEALTNIYVGLSRQKRGEKLSAMRFIQNYAVDRILELSERIAPTGSELRDEFSLERRYEQNYPQIALNLPEFLQGYERNIESAMAILAFLDQHFEVNPNMKREILKLYVSEKA